MRAEICVFEKGTAFISLNTTYPFPGSMYFLIPSDGLLDYICLKEEYYTHVPMFYGAYQMIKKV